MNRTITTATAFLAMLASPVFAEDPGIAGHPPDAPYQAVSDLVKLPDFLPGIGQIFVDPATLPAGPFIAYDRDGRLVSTIYMIPISSMNADTGFDNLAAPGGNVDHVDIYYNAGHPGVAEPHEHIVLWHVPVADETSVAQ